MPDGVELLAELAAEKEEEQRTAEREAATG